MKTKLSLIAASILTLSLVGCAQGGQPTTQNSDASSDIINSEVSSDQSETTGNGSSSTNEDVDPSKKVLMETAISYLDDAIVSEALRSNGGTMTTSTFTNNLSTIETTNHTVFKDKSSYATGRKYQTNKGEEYQGATFKSRTQKVVDRIESDGQQNDFNMFKRVVDYEDESISNAYSDRAESAFIVANKDEATLGGLQEGDYIVNEQYPIETSMQGAKNLKYFILSNVLGNPTASQYYDLTFKIKDVDAGISYSCDISYNYKGDGVIFTDEIVINFVMNDKNDRLLNADATFKTTEARIDDETDFSTTGIHYEMSLNYGERVDVNTDMDVNDYFLHEISDVKILQNGKYGAFEEVDADKVSLATSYIKGEAKTFTPSTAINKTLIPVSSSNEEVALVDATGSIEILGLGTTTITFTYSGKVNGICKQLSITKEITVNKASVSDVYIIPSGKFENNTINVGDEYEISAGVLPSEANQEITVSCDHPEILDVKVSPKGFTIKGLKAGTATVKAASKEAPTVFDTLTIKVLAKDVNYKDLIVNKTYKYTSLYSSNYYLLKFNADGTGVKTEVSGSGKKYEDTFTYTIESNIIKFANWTENVPESGKWSQCTILNENATELKVSGEWSDDDGSHPYIYEFKEVNN